MVITGQLGGYHSISFPVRGNNHLTQGQQCSLKRNGQTWEFFLESNWIYLEREGQVSRIIPSLLWTECVPPSCVEVLISDGTILEDGIFGR